MNHLETSRMDRYFCPHHPPPKYNRNNIFLYLWPLTLFLIFTPFFTLDKGAHVSLASKSCLSEAMSVQVEAIPSLCLQPAPCCSPCSVELCCPVKLVPTARLPITGPTGICYLLTKQTDCANSCLHVAFLSLVFREELDVKSIEVCTEKDKNLYFSLPTSRKIFLQFAWGIFFFF